MSNKIEGTIHKIFKTQVISSTFQKREFVIKTNEDYPQMIKIEFTQDKCNLLDAFKQGQEVEVFFNIRGREWLNRENVEVYFVTLQAWRIAATSNQPTQSTYDEYVSSTDDMDNTDDLPF